MGMRYYVLTSELHDRNGRHISPDYYELSHSGSYPTLTAARKAALNDPQFWMVQMKIYEGTDARAKFIGTVTRLLKGEGTYHVTSANVYIERSGKAWYLNNDGTLGNRYKRK